MKPTNIETPDYWNAQYLEEKIRWDVGYAIPAIMDYMSQITYKSLKILIPGAGSAYEAIDLYNRGFKNVFILDFSDVVIQDFITAYPDFPIDQIIQDNFFNHQGSYDLILEHTFFSALPINKRSDYVNKSYDLLSDSGKMVGLLFNRSFNGQFPPYGGDIETYRNLFSKKFHIKTLENAKNSIKPRRNTELFFIFEKN